MDIKITSRTATVYKVTCGKKTQSFLKKGAVVPWIAKQHMLPIFDRFHSSFGEIENPLGCGIRTVWSEWSERKAWFITRYWYWIRKGMDMFDAMAKTSEELTKYFEEDFV